MTCNCNMKIFDAFIEVAKWIKLLATSLPQLMITCNAMYPKFSYLNQENIEFSDVLHLFELKRFSKKKFSILLAKELSHILYK